MAIKYLENKYINYKKWDKCINRSFNGIVYAYSWYLDIVSDDWDALVSGNYEAVMPLPIKKKFGFKYIYQPSYTQQLGVFSTGKLDSKMVLEFLKQIPADFKYVQTSLNTFNALESQDFNLEKKVTYQLDLIKPYELIYRGYSTNTKRNIKKAIKNKIFITKGLAVNDLIEMRRRNPVVKLTEEHYNTMRKIISFALLHKVGACYGAYSDRNNLIAAAFFITSHNKSIFLISVSSAEGKEKRAMFYILDYFIKIHAENPVILDFEGSMIESLARFFSGFGAKACNYLSVSQNRLPWPLKLLKK